MTRLEFKKHKRGFEVNVFDGKNSKSSYTNIINKDFNGMAQILIDLYLFGFPIEKAIKIFLSRVRQKDWLGL